MSKNALPFPPPQLAQQDDAQVLRDAERLREAIGRFVRAVRLSADLPAAHAAALGHLDRHGPLSITGLAEREQVRHQTMAKIVKLLRERGLATVETDPRDRRRLTVRLSPAGHTRLQQHRQARATDIATRIAALNPEERDRLRTLPDLLDKLTAADRAEPAA